MLLEMYSIGSMCVCERVCSHVCQLHIVPEDVLLHFTGSEAFDHNIFQQVYLQEGFLPPDHGETHNLWWKRLSLKLTNTQKQQYENIIVMVQLQLKGTLREGH